jgi:mannose-6-phosphate isomerase-like protein (cupin superfamily)
MIETGNLSNGFKQIDEYWRPKIVTTVNDHEVKIVKMLGEFPWHSHEGIDELFLCWKGTFKIEFRDRVVEISSGDFCKVPRGVEHRPVVEQEAEAILFETSGLRNTGNIVDDVFMAPLGARISVV